MTVSKTRRTGAVTARRVWQGRWTSLATSLVFAAGAFLGLLLIGPHYEVRVVFDPNADTVSRVDEPSLRAVARSPDFVAAVVARLDGDTRVSRPLRLFERLVAVLDGTSSDGVALGSQADAFGVSVARDAAGAQISIEVTAGSVGEAQALATAVAAELAKRIADEASAAPGIDNIAVIEESRRRVEEARARVSALPDLQAGGALAGEVEQRGNVLQDVRRLLDLVEERIDALQRLAEDATADAPLDRVAEPELRAQLDAYRALANATIELAGTLPDGNPRLRITRLRLDQLQAALAPAIQSAIASAQDERGTLAARVSSLEGEMRARERELAAARVDLDARAALLDEVAAAEERLAAIVAIERDREAEALRQGVPPIPSVEAVRLVSPPYWETTGLAALAGLIVGSLGSAAAALAASRRDGGVSTGNATARLDISRWSQTAAPEGSSIGASQDREQGFLSHDSMNAAETVSALLASRISRALLVACDDEAGPSIGLRLARDLADHGRLVLLVDLSPSQRVMREAGGSQRTMGFSEVTSRALGLSSVTVTDEKSAVDLVSSGLTPDDPAAGRARAEALRYAARAYDHVLVDCGLLPAAEVLALADTNSAVLLDAVAVLAERKSERLRELDAAGLDTAILTG